MKQENKPIVLANCGLRKLREYSRAYGNPETLSVPYIKDWGTEISTHNETGVHIRTFKKGTKLLIDFRGEPISERAYTLRTNKAKKAAEAKAAAQEAQEAARMEETKRLADVQAKAWAAFLQSNPDKMQRYRERVSSSPSNSSRKGNWRNWIRMKAAQKIAGEKFSNLALGAPDLAKILFSMS